MHSSSTGMHSRLNRGSTTAGTVPTVSGNVDCARSSRLYLIQIRIYRLHNMMRLCLVYKHEVKSKANLSYKSRNLQINDLLLRAGISWYFGHWGGWSI